MRDLMNLFTQPQPQAVRAGEPEVAAERRRVPSDHPLVDQLNDVAFAHSLCMHVHGLDTHNAMRMAARGLDIPQDRYDFLLAEHRRLTGIVPGTSEITIGITLNPSTVRREPLQ